MSGRDDWVGMLSRIPATTETKRPENGSLIQINERRYMNVLPSRVKKFVDEFGYVPKFYDYLPGYFSTIIETCLKDNRKNGAIMEYASSLKSSEQLADHLRYYAIIHVKSISEAICLNDEKEIGVIIVYEHEKMKKSTVLLLSAPDIIKYSLWIENISEGISRHLKGIGAGNRET